MDPDFLSILVCPKSKKPLREARVEELQQINERIGSETVRNVGGEVVTTPLEAGLVSEDGEVLYAIRDGIPVLLVSEGISLAG